MSYAPEILSVSPRETVKEKHASPGVLMNDKLKLAHHSSVSVHLSYLRAPTTLDGMNVTHHVNERVYGCKYCHKNFCSKKALGGHQNGHKIKRVIERNAREELKTSFGRVQDPPYHGMTFVNIGPKVFNYSMRNMSYNPQYKQHGMLENSHPYSNLSMIQEPHANETLQEFKFGYPIWPNPHLTDSQFIAPSTRMENHALNLLNSTFETASSNARTILGVYGGISTGNYLSLIHDTNLRAEINSQITNSTSQQCQVLELDLSLKL